MADQNDTMCLRNGGRPTLQERNLQSRAAQDRGIIPKRSENAHYVYIICASSFAMKVGVAIDLKSRLEALQVGNHVWLRLLGAYRFQTRSLAEEVERAAHAAVGEHRLQGEWFRVRVKEVRDAIDAYCESRRIVAVWTNSKGKERLPNWLKASHEPPGIG